jgi:hypothetical protein
MAGFVFFQENQGTIFVEHATKPEGWSDNWNRIFYGTFWHNVNWGHTDDQLN